MSVGDVPESVEPCKDRVKVRIPEEFDSCDSVRLSEFEDDYLPYFNLPRVAELCGYSDDKMYRLALAAEQGKWIQEEYLPDRSERVKRKFSVQETQELVRRTPSYVGQSKMRRPFLLSIVANPWNEVSDRSRSSTLTIAQALSLRGHRVLCVDLNPYCAISKHLGADFGNYPSGSICHEILYRGKPVRGWEFWRQFAKKTFWPNIDLIAGSVVGAVTPFLKSSRGSWHGDLAILVSGFQSLASPSIAEQYDYVVLELPSNFDTVSFCAQLAVDAFILTHSSNMSDWAHVVRWFKNFSDMIEKVPTPVAERNYMFALMLECSASVSVEYRYLPDFRLGDGLIRFRMPGLPAKMPCSVYEMGKFNGLYKGAKFARDAYDELARFIDSNARAGVNVQQSE